MEREFNLKYALNVMGCRVLPYWLGTFAFDFIVYCVGLLIFVILVYIFNFSYVIDVIWKIIYNLVLFGFAYITFSYMCGFMFEKSGSALKSFPIFNFFIPWSLAWSISGILTMLY